MIAFRKHTTLLTGRPEHGLVRALCALCGSNGRHSGRLAGHQVSRTEPGRQRRVTALDDSPSQQAYFFATGATPQDTRTRLETERLAGNVASRADEPAMPAGLFEIPRTGRVAAKRALKLPQRLRKRQIFTGQDIQAKR